MTTIKVTVDSRKNARLLTKILKSMAFVKRIEEDSPIAQKSDQFTKLKDIIDSIEPESMFRAINSPEDWQKNIRDEWEAH
ncbi:MAG TPA: hypothetical protein VK205_07355 [Prolixibacteraceae bacterium]|nr:hypothetical protein [Prolixibacteraceae bacterium]